MLCDQSPETLVMVWSRLALEANHHHHLGQYSKVNDILKGKASIMSALNAIHHDGTWEGTTIFSAITWQTTLKTTLPHFYR